MTESKTLRWKKWIERIAAHAQSRQVHMANCVVLLPYAQLLPVAARQWAQAFPQGFAPRFETTLSWSRSLEAPSATIDNSANDITFDVALDALTAHTLLEQAGLASQADILVARLLDAAQQLAPQAAAVAPSARAAWAMRVSAAAQATLAGPELRFESAVTQIALAWAAHSNYATDVLLSAPALPPERCLVVLQGFQAEPLSAALCALWGESALVIQLNENAHAGSGHDTGTPAALATHPITVHCADDAEDEAQLAAACVLQQVNAGRIPVALVATDRALTRSVRSMLEAGGLVLRDETGWKLSTSHSAAQVMACLRASMWNTSSDQVLDWLKNAPAFDPVVTQQLERIVRRQALREWQSRSLTLRPDETTLQALLLEIEALRETMQRSRPVALWLVALRELLLRCGLWEPLQADTAGEKLIEALHLSDEACAHLQTQFSSAAWARRTLSLSDFMAWVNQALEAASFSPAYPEHEQVVILPLAQLLARPFAAVIIPACDEVRLNPALEPAGIWSAGQRLALGLPSRASLALAQRAAWEQALQTPSVVVLWRRSGEGGEPLLASPLLQALKLEPLTPKTQKDIATDAIDPRSLREVVPSVQERPAPSAPQLSVSRLSASAYEDLRRCPYRFFAMRQLGLKEEDELESEVDKRDFGLWLHAVLKKFHDTLAHSSASDLQQRTQLLDAAADAVTQQQQLAQAEFLPFKAVWPRVREGYLQWLVQHEASGVHFDSAESDQQLSLGPVTLIGRIDRIDRFDRFNPANNLQATHTETEADAARAMVIDYKTESLDTTKKRVKSASEDTQLAFYAALLEHDTLKAAYLNVGERGEIKLVEQTQIVEVRDALVEGIVDDMTRIAQGAVLPALGQASACEYCAARGLCRKDFWRTA